ncbi:MAG: SusC/RagA family TonB-linked outer membrane protein [Rikenellaceae bacterium]|jgi:TonB-linked SusC/RagA family outer membrane protein|nr:SusC/RagA family TonB-linked outer membrane protein [Rikenellaceae bacterium]
MLLLVFVLGAGSPATAQNVTVGGAVHDDAGKQLPGVSVRVKGGTGGTTSDGEGKFSIQVPGRDATLVFSGIGYRTVEQAVGSRDFLQVIMSEDEQQMKELVVIGYGSQRKEDLSMSVSSVKMDDVVKGRPSDIGTVLQGRIPGLTIQKEGDPLKGTAFAIRGRGSKGEDNDRSSANGVLFVVDGVPNAPYSIEDVETVTVLKDAASSAIYGSKVGASGVVLITTKKAKAGRIRVDVNASNGYQSVRNLPNMLTAKQYNEVWAKAVANSSGAMLPSAADPAQYPEGEVTRTDWLKEIFRTGRVQHYGVTLSGGSETITSLFSLAYDKSEGTLLNTWSEGINARLTNSFQATKWLKFSEQLTVAYSDGQGNVDTSHEGPIMGAVWYPRSASVYQMNPDGTYVLDAKGGRVFGGTTLPGSNVAGYPSLYNPVAALTRMHRRYPDAKVFSTSSLEINPIKSLSFHSDFTANLNLRDADEFYPKMLESGLIRAANFREEFHTKTYHWLWENVATYSKVFAAKHNVNAMAGFSMDFVSTSRKETYTQTYPLEDEHGLIYDGAAWNRNPVERKFEESMLSAFGRVSYSYDDRYFMVGSLRRDGSSRLPEGRQYDLFPAVSASWKLTSEPFVRSLGLNGWLNLFKVRGGWGRVGNVDLYPSDVAEATLQAEQRGAIFGSGLDNQIYGTYLSTIPNPYARWEVTEQTSIGIDLGLFDRSLEVTVDWYDKRTKDLIDRIPTPQHIGVSVAPMGNMGEVVNRGWEFSAAWHRRLGQVGVNVWGQLNFNNGYVKSYGTRLDPVAHTSPNLNSRTLLYSQAGYPWHSFMVYRTAGIFRSDDEVAKYVYKDPKTGQTSIIMPNAKAGDLRYVDTNSDGKIDSKDMVLMGSYDPTRTFSFGASADYRGFDLSLMFYGVAGNHIYNGLKQMAMNGRNDGGNLIVDVLDAYDFNPSGSKWPRLALANDPNGNYSNHTDMFLERGDYLRLKNITLGYTLPASLMRLARMDKCTVRVYASADNLLTFTDYTGIDPEVSNYGIDRGVYPVPRFFNFGINLNF